jgi:formate hydrogenlyase subunit 3/multisubunit Na+/H+ antiporter MnhD subunit
VSFTENWFSFVGGGRSPWLDFAGGRLELFFALVFGFIGLMALLYSAVKIRGRGGLVVEYFVFLVLLVASAIGVVYARNLLLIFAAWELATFVIWRLVLFHRAEDDVGAASWAWFVNFGAATMMLVGMAIILFEEKTLSLDQLRGAELSTLPAVLILIGILAKSATLPLYVWLPKAYKSAPAPVCAMLSGIAENIGIVLFLKLFVMTARVPQTFMITVAGLGVVSSLVAGGIALRARTLRGLLAYSTISQLGFIFLGLAMVSYYGLLGGLLYVLAHAVAKAGLFFSAGMLEDATGSGELEALGGGARKAPVLAVAAALLMLSIVGMPPLLGFFAKLWVLAGALESNLMLGVGAIVAALFTLLYMVRFYTKAFLGEPKTVEWRPISGFLTALVVVLALVSLAGGIAAFGPVDLLRDDVLKLVGGF